MTGTIKRLFLAVGITVSLSAVAQHYAFDYLIISKHRTVSRNFELSVQPKALKGKGLKNSQLINSQNADYKLLFFFDAYNKDRKTGSIVDEKNKVAHGYKLYPASQDDEIGFRLGYVGTYSRKDTEYSPTVEGVQKIGDMIYEITSSNNSKGKYKLTVRLSESPDDLLHSVRLEGLGFQEDMISQLKKQLDPDKNYFISEYVEQHIPGSTFHVRTEAKKLKVPLQVQIINKKQ